MKISLLDLKPVAARLYFEYLSELMAIQGALPGQGTFMERFEAEWEAEDSYWYFLHDGDELVGFVVVGQYPNCHPAADYYIEDVYVHPMYRGKGLVRDFLIQHMKETGGSVYCLFVLVKNTMAARFWDHVFTLAGYEPLALSEIAKPEPLLIQKGYRAKE